MAKTRQYRIEKDGKRVPIKKVQPAQEKDAQVETVRLPVPLAEKATAQNIRPRRLPRQAIEAQLQLLDEQVEPLLPPVQTEQQ